MTFPLIFTIISRIFPRGVFGTLSNIFDGAFLLKWGYCETFKNTFFEEHLQMATFEYYCINQNTKL